MLGKIRGAPGSGKTRAIKDLAVEAVNKYGVERVCILSHTNAGVAEITGRVTDELGVSLDGIRHAMTIHALCGKLLSFRYNMLAEKHIKEFNEQYPQFQVSVGKLADDEVNDPHVKRNDLLFSEMNVNRNTLLGLKDWKPDTRDLWLAWREWMQENDFLDFTGLLERTFMLELCPDVDVIIVDEAQDASSLQYKLTHMWAEDAISTIWAADPDQSVFRWSGACPEAFLSIKAGWNKYLNQSYRMPRALHQYVHENLLYKMTDREYMEILPKNEEGEVLHSDAPDFTKEGTHMILCRCNFQVKPWIEHCITQGVLWYNPYREENLYWNPSHTKGFKAAKLHRKLMAGHELSMTELNILSTETRAKGNMRRGSKKEIKELQGLGSNEKVDLFSCMNYGFLPEYLRDDKPLHEKLMLKGTSGEMIRYNPKILDAVPRAIIGTVHSVKGGEAENVWIDSRLPYNIEKSIRQNEESMNDELRVQYVGATRSSHTLGIMR